MIPQTDGPARRAGGDVGAWWSHAALLAVCASLSGALLASRLPMLATRRFDPDELEHAHAAWYVHLGYVPFRDFFEHHTPLFHYLLAGFFALFDIARSPDAAFGALFAARHLTWVISVAVVGLTFVLARRVRDTTTAWGSLPLVSGSIVMALRAPEIRPDGLSTALWLLAVIGLQAGFTSDRPDAPATRMRFGAAGIAVALAVLTSQKLLLAGPAIAVLLVWYMADSRFGRSVGARLTNVLCQAGGVVAVWGAALLWFAAQGAAGRFLQFTLFDNLRWKSETTAGSILTFIVGYEPWLFALTALGVTFAVRDVGRGGHRARSAVVLLTTAGVMFGGLFLIPVPYAQYCLTFIPLFAVLGATGLVEAARMAAGARDVGAQARGKTVLVAILAFAVLSAVGLFVSRPVVVSPFVYPTLVVASLAAFVALRWWPQPHLALSVALVVFAVLPAQWTSWMLDLGDRGQFAEMRLVLTRTSPDDIVLDGWSGYGVFRRHANYYWMFHPGVRAMLGRPEVDALVQDVESGRVQPAVVVLDESLRALSPDLATWVESRYESTGRGSIFVRESTRGTTP